MVVRSGKVVSSFPEGNARRRVEMSWGAGIWWGLLMVVEVYCGGGSGGDEKGTTMH